MTTNSQDYVTFSDLLRGIWAVKYGILIGALVGVVACVFYLNNTTPEYEASMVVGPVAQEDQGLHDLVLKNRQTSFLKDFLRQAVPVQAPQFEAFEHNLTGSDMARELMRREDVLQNLFWEKWEPTSKSWEQDTGFNTKIEAVFTGTQAHSKPTQADVKKYLGKEIVIAPVGLTDFKRVSYRHPDPEFAKNFLSSLFNQSDRLLRDKSKAETQTRIEYLQNKLRQIRNAEHRDVLISLLKEQERGQLMVAVDLPFAAQIIESPFVSAKPVSPNVWLCLLVSLMSGGIFGGLLSQTTRKET